MSGCAPEVGIDPQKMKDRLQHKWDWIWDVDLKQDREEAMQAL